MRVLSKHASSFKRSYIGTNDPGNLGGFGFAKLSEDGAKEIEGFGCPFCLDCTRKGAQRLSKQFSRLMERQLGLVAVQVH